VQPKSIDRRVDAAPPAAVYPRATSARTSPDNRRSGATAELHLPLPGHTADTAATHPGSLSSCRSCAFHSPVLRCPRTFHSPVFRCSGAFHSRLTGPDSAATAAAVGRAALAEYPGDTAAAEYSPVPSGYTGTSAAASDLSLSTGAGSGLRRRSQLWFTRRHRSRVWCSIRHRHSKVRCIRRRHSPRFSVRRALPVRRVPRPHTLLRRHRLSRSASSSSKSPRFTSTSRSVRSSSRSSSSSTFVRRSRSNRAEAV